MDVHSYETVSQVKSRSMSQRIISVPAMSADASSQTIHPAWYWSCQALGWLAVAWLNIQFAGPDSAEDVRKNTFIFIWASLTGMLLSHGWRTSIKRESWLGAAKDTGWVALIVGNGVLGALQVLFVAAAFGILRPAGAFSNWAWLPGALLFWSFIFVGWTSLYATVASIRRARRSELEALRLQILAKDAELRALQAQVNPHFFFNSLNSVRALIFQNPPDAAKMIDLLASLMRYALQSSDVLTVALCDEMDAVRDYLAIEKIRFEERLRFQFDVAADLDDFPIPPMALQTLVENAVKYGVERSVNACEIRLSVKRENGMVQIEVANQGILNPFENSTRVGFENARKRLTLAYGTSAQLTLSERDGWVRAQLQLPEL